MGRAILGVVAGYAAIGVLVVLTDQLFAALVPGFRGMVQPPLYYFLISLATDFLYSIVGGYLCGLIARERVRGAVLALMIAGEVIGLATQVFLWNMVPHWFGLGLLVLYPIGVWLGSAKLRTRPSVV
jgi:hypothetical protein